MNTVRPAARAETHARALKAAILAREGRSRPRPHGGRSSRRKVKLIRSLRSPGWRGTPCT
jgi:hypothetical protein